MVSSFFGFLGGLVGGFIAWIFTEFLAMPIKRFRQLRNDVAEALALYEDEAWRFDHGEEDPPNNEWFGKRKEKYEVIGAALMGFANSQRCVTRILCHKVLGKRRYNISSAGSYLKMLGYFKHVTPDSAPGMGSQVE